MASMYRVKLRLDRPQYAYVEVEADSAEEAGEKALAGAKDAPWEDAYDDEYEATVDDTERIPE